ncbi:64_t:CDS:2 [Acaulospora colombiana]|uniref:64_t:CDS:1 n=1 Tax=Acaulospora colombiana TaxID=27376 RepID=A0ACA9MEM0_9GLOM|nr:64_t:CDS:2 [Acaulospora colombiana]
MSLAKNILYTLAVGPVSFANLALNLQSPTKPTSTDILSKKEKERPPHGESVLQASDPKHHGAYIRNFSMAHLPFSGVAESLRYCCMSVSSEYPPELSSVELWENKRKGKWGNPADKAARDNGKGKGKSLQNGHIPPKVETEAGVALCDPQPKIPSTVSNPEKQEETPKVDIGSGRGIDHINEIGEWDWVLQLGK